MLYSLVFSRFVNLYYSYRHVRSDNTLILYLLKGFFAWLKKSRDNVCNVFNSCRYTLEVESGKLNGDKYIRYQYISSKKDFSERYGSSCMEAVFERLAERSV